MRSNLCKYNNGYVLARGDITIIGDSGTQVAFKNCTLFTNCITNIYGTTIDDAEDCITKIYGTTIDDAEDLHLVMPMYSLLECSPNYSQLILMLMLRIMMVLNLLSINPI